MAERATGIAYGIEFFVGRRSRDRAISDVKTAGELINQNSLMAFKKGSQQRQQAHAEAIQQLRTKSKTALEELGAAREKAASEATAAFNKMQPPSVAQLEAQKGRKLNDDELKEYSATLGRELNLWKLL
jgi:hypothetical protein